MGPEFWKPQVSTHLKKCSEFHDPTCGQPITDGCCAVIPCSYCLLWTPYTGTVEKGTATDGSTGWTGTIAGVEFHAYWEVGYASGVCEFVVTLAGVEIYRQDCYGGQQCRDSSDSVVTTIATHSGTLTWTKILHRPLEYVVDSTTHCRKHFCGTCECTCTALCATLVLPTASCCTVTFNMPDVSYPCDGPVWSATAVCNGHSYPVTLSLIDGGSYGCELGGTFNGTTLTPVILSSCTGWTATFVLYDGTTLTVVCDDCNCTVIPACSEGCCWPYTVTAQYPCGYPLPVPFEITAPGCDLNGQTGTFTNSALGAHGSCGTCAGGGAPLPFNTIGTLRVEAPGHGYCLTTPCGISLTLYLECLDTSSVAYGQNACCGKLRLWVGSTVRLAGWDGTAPATGSSALYWNHYAPTSCSCLGGGAGFSAIFAVSLVGDCATSFTSGPCVGLPTCCTPVCSGFTLTI